jgi:hypothetical protein
MPFTKTNDYLGGRMPMPFPAGGEVLAVRATVDVAVGDLVQGDTGAIMLLPAGCVPVDVHVDATDLDTSTAAMVLQVGICNAAVTDLSTAADDGGAHWGVTTAANAAFHQRLTFNGQALVSVKPKQVDRKVGVKVATAPTTAQAGTIGVTLFYRAA